MLSFRRSAPPSPAPAGPATVAPPASHAVEQSSPMNEKITIVQPLSQNSNPFTSGSIFSDYPIPKDLSTLKELTLQMNLAFATADASGVDVQVVQTPFAINRLELRYAGKELQRQESPELAYELLSWKADNEFQLERARYNASATGGLNPSFNVAAGATVNQTWYLPVSLNVLGSGLFIRGFTDQWVVRVYWAPTIVASCNTTGTNHASAVTVTAVSMPIYATSLVQSPASEAALQAAHQRGVNYRTVLRTKWSPNAFASLSNGAVQVVQMQGFAGCHSAAIVAYLQAAQPSGATQLLQHYPIASLQLRTSSNSELTQVMPLALIQSHEAGQVPQNSLMFTSNPTNNVLWSFCGKLSNVLRSGKWAGGYRLSGAEFFDFTPASSLSNVTLTIVSYDYALLRVTPTQVTLDKVTMA